MYMLIYTYTNETVMSGWLKLKSDPLSVPSRLAAEALGDWSYCYSHRWRK